MLKAEDVLKLKILKSEGMNISVIARKTGYDRHTIKKYVTNETQIVQMKKRQRKSKNLCEPFSEIIIDHIKNGLSAAYIYRDLTTKHGFLGGYTTLKDFVRHQRQNLQLPHENEFSASLWTLKILQRGIQQPDLELQFKDKLDTKDLNMLYSFVNNKPINYRNKALTILLHLKGISKTAIAITLSLDRKTIRTYIQLYEEKGIENLFELNNKSIMKYDDPKYKNAVLRILHAPPSCYGLNRTTWWMIDIKNVMEQNDLPICKDNIRKIIKNAGYNFRKAKRVLTSNDPNYMEKLKQITKILSDLKPEEKFFSIDEYGPFAIKTQGGKSLVPTGQTKTVPQWQKSKGSLIITGALELSTNQITHFYSEKKNTGEMIKLVHVLLKDYKNEDCIYLSWDEASWHCSKKLCGEVEEINSPGYRKELHVPFVKLVPLPSSAQFLNVIESVFSGMARAIIHNSDYQSVKECKEAIDKHFAERNKYFRENPKRAGNKIWGKEPIEAKFSESNICRNPAFR